MRLRWRRCLSAREWRESRRWTDWPPIERRWRMQRRLVEITTCSAGRTRWQATEPTARCGVRSRGSMMRSNRMPQACGCGQGDRSRPLRPRPHRHLARVRLTQAPQRGPHRLLRRVAHAHVPRVLGEVGGRHVAPVALADLDGDPEVEARVACSMTGRCCGTRPPQRSVRTSSGRSLARCAYATRASCQPRWPIRRTRRSSPVLRLGACGWSRQQTTRKNRLGWRPRTGSGARKANHPTRWRGTRRGSEHPGPLERPHDED